MSPNENLAALNRTIVVTGGTGFIGRQVVPILLQSGFNVRLVTRKHVEEYSKEGRFEEVITSDLFQESPSWWAEVCTGADQVLHLAWIATPGEYLNSTRNFDCLRGTISIAQGAIAAGVKHFTGTGTCLEYEKSKSPIAVTQALLPSSIYAACKTATFLALSQLFRTQGVLFAWCRLFHLYGANEDPRRLAGYLQKCFDENRIAELSEGRDVLDFSNVTEVAEKIAQVIDSRFQGPANICSGKAMSVREFAVQMAANRNKPDLLQFAPDGAAKSPPAYLVGIPTKIDK